MKYTILQTIAPYVAGQVIELSTEAELKTAERWCNAGMATAGCGTPAESAPEPVAAPEPESAADVIPIPRKTKPRRKKSSLFSDTKEAE